MAKGRGVRSAYNHVSKDQMRGEVMPHWEVYLSRTLVNLDGEPYGAEGCRGKRRERGIVNNITGFRVEKEKLVLQITNEEEPTRKCT